MAAIWCSGVITFETDSANERSDAYVRSYCITDASSAPCGHKAAMEPLGNKPFLDAHAASK